MFVASLPVETYYRVERLFLERGRLRYMPEIIAI